MGQFSDKFVQAFGWITGPGLPKRNRWNQENRQAVPSKKSWKPQAQ